MIRDYSFHLKADNFKVTAFFPYTSGVSMPILSQNHNYKTEEADFLTQFGNQIRELAEAKGCRWDNKVVVEITQDLKGNTNWIRPAVFYVGFYDNIISVGCGVWQDNWLEKDNRNKYFKD